MPRRKPALLGPFLAVTLTSVALAQAVPTETSFTQVTEAQAAVELLPAGSEPGASDLASTTGCHETTPRTAVIGMAWSGGPAIAVSQRVDISKFHEGFDTGRYETTGSLPGSTNTIAFVGAEPGIAYYWRVLDETPAGWVTSAVERFEAPTCPYDPPSETTREHLGIEADIDQGGASR